MMSSCASSTRRRAATLETQQDQATRRRSGIGGKVGREWVVQLPSLWVHVQNRVLCVLQRCVCRLCFGVNNESIDPATACLAKSHKCPARLSCALFGLVWGWRGLKGTLQGFSGTEGPGPSAWAPLKSLFSLLRLCVHRVTSKSYVPGSRPEPEQRVWITSCSSRRKHGMARARMLAVLVFVLSGAAGKGTATTPKRGGDPPF